jgi:hypothetical protein
VPASGLIPAVIQVFIVLASLVSPARRALRSVRQEVARPPAGQRYPDWLGFSIQSLCSEHGEIEAALDSIAESLVSGELEINAVERAHLLCIRHYQHEEAFLLWLAERDAPLAAKLRGQHEEALELAGHLLQDAGVAAQVAERVYLARRFLAITRHNIIEEERDVFPFVANRDSADSG